MKDIAIIGAGGFGREVKMLIDQINRHQPAYNLVGFYDDGVRSGTIINGFPVLGEVEMINRVTRNICIIVAIGSPQLKEKMISKINNPFISYPTLIHPNALIGDDNVNLGKGCIICAGTIITVNIDIGDHVILNLSCTVGHDSKIGNYCSFMPSVNVSGEVNINDYVYIGTGAKIINQLEIGTHSIIGAGAVVSRSIPAKCTAVGIPAKPIRYHET
ncbi:MAG: acetyltransferase [Pedobacter sp.]|nr:MAG: acetyltransferase [Pedobacter sp.]